MNWAKQFTRREKVLLTILTVILLAAAYFFLVQTPVANSIEKAEQSSAELDDQLVILEARKKSMENMLEELETIRTNSNAIYEIPETDNLQHIMSYFNMVFGSFESYRLESEGTELDEENISGIARRNLTLSFVCPNYSVARSAINKIQDSPYLCQPNELDIHEPAGEKKGKAKLSSRTLHDGGKVAVEMTFTFFEHPSDGTVSVLTAEKETGKKKKK